MIWRIMLRFFLLDPHYLQHGKHAQRSAGEASRSQRELITGGVHCISPITIRAQSIYPVP
ncbi:hypothetical protein OAU96_00485 [Planctomycetota bacterium]|nr:hypothetical protein [Planctomycetota bacterium]